jgi:hypothetical protein
MVTPALAVQIWAPDTMVGELFDTVEVPILVSGQTGRNIISADITVSFRQEVLAGTGGYRLGSAASGWMVVVNPLPCSLLVGMASASPLGAGDTLVFLEMAVRAPDTSRVEFARCRLNEGQVPCTTRTGFFIGQGTGIEERNRLVSEQLNLPSIVRGSIRLTGNRSALLLDASGRQKVRLEPGANDIGQLRPGVYFIRQDPTIAKVIVRN